VGSRRSAVEVAELRRMLAGNDSAASALERRLHGMSDSVTLAQLQRANDSLRALADVASRGDEATRASARAQMSRWQQGATALAQADLPTIHERNAPAVAYLVTELAGQVTAGTAFAITPEGRMLTNRHLVRAPDGTAATRLVVKFRDSREWIPASVVRVATGEDDDLALIQLDHDARVPTVLGIAPDVEGAREGAPVMTIGYPHAQSTRMEGEGDAFVAKTSLSAGTVSKRLSTVLQIAAYAGRGSSGSPVFDARGLVIGVVWGGPRESAGQLVYAVPAGRIREFIDGR